MTTHVYSFKDKGGGSTYPTAHLTPFSPTQWFSVFALCGGVALVLKCGRSRGSLWARNIQMSLSSMFFTLLFVFLNDRGEVLSKGFFFGYTPWVSGFELYSESYGVPKIGEIVWPP